MEENQKIPMRSQVKKEDTWAIEDMYATVEDWEKDFVAAKKVAEEAAEYAGRLGESAQALYDLSLIHISEPTRLGMISYAVFCLKKKKNICRLLLEKKKKGE